MNCEKDFLIIFLENSYSDDTIEGFFYIFSSFFDIQYDEEEFELEKEKYALISKKKIMRILIHIFLLLRIKI